MTAKKIHDAVKKIADTMPMWENSDGFSAWTAPNANGDGSTVLWVRHASREGVSLICLLPFGAGPP